MVHELKGTTSGKASETCHFSVVMPSQETRVSRGRIGTLRISRLANRSPIVMFRSWRGKYGCLDLYDGKLTETSILPGLKIGRFEQFLFVSSMCQNDCPEPTRSLPLASFHLVTK